jgi:hypothetical protein
MTTDADAERSMTAATLVDLITRLAEAFRLVGVNYHHPVRISRQRLKKSPTCIECHGTVSGIAAHSVP